MGLSLRWPLPPQSTGSRRAGLSSCGAGAQPLRSMWDPPRPGPKPASPAPAGRLSTTAPPGKPITGFLMKVGQDDQITPGRWREMKNLIRNQRWSDPQSRGFWLNQLTRVLAKSGQCKEEHRCPKIKASLDSIQRSLTGTSLAVQSLRLCLPMQGVRVRSLVGELSSYVPRSQKPKT